MINNLITNLKNTYIMKKALVLGVMALFAFNIANAQPGGTTRTTAPNTDTQKVEKTSKANGEAKDAKIVKENKDIKPEATTTTEVGKTTLKESKSNKPEAATEKTIGKTTLKTTTMDDPKLSVKSKTFKEKKDKAETDKAKGAKRD